MKVGIITITQGCNYGNRLQNYALQQVLAEFGVDSETIRYKPEYQMELNKSNAIKKLLKFYSKLDGKEIIFDLKGKILRSLYKKKMRLGSVEKENNFREFINKYISITSEVYCSDSNLTAIDKKYDKLICGSDQIWNPFWEGSNSFYFANFASKGKKIAYAASFGTESIPKHMHTFVKKNVSEMDYVSCREDSAKRIVKSIAGRDVDVVIDPVLLLSAQDWQERLNIKKESNRPYILKYYLEGETLEANKFSQMLVKKYGYDVVSIDLCTHDKTLYISPDKFVELIMNANYICTNSFHAVAFSLIFEKKFKVFGRLSRSDFKYSDEFAKKNISSRMTGLLRELGLEHTLYTECKEDLFLNLEKDYLQAKKILEVKKNDSKKYLKRALDR